MKNENLPKLGRPFTGGSPRQKYLKFYLTADELKDFEKIENSIDDIFSHYGYVYNRPAVFRAFLKRLNDPLFIHLLLSSPTPEMETFKIIS